jgi:hypothetical protein
MDGPCWFRGTLAQVKPGVVIVNTARGGSVDEDALLASLKEGRVRAAALDVFVGEPEPREDLMTAANLSLSPHIGAATAEAQAAWVMNWPTRSSPGAPPLMWADDPHPSLPRLAPHA